MMRIEGMESFPSQKEQWIKLGTMLDAYLIQYIDKNDRGEEYHITLNNGKRFSLIVGGFPDTGGFLNIKF